MPRASVGWLLVGVLATSAGCSSTPADDPPAPQTSGAESTPSTSAAGEPTPSEPTPSEPGPDATAATGTATPDAGPGLPPVTRRVSLPALMRDQPSGGRPRVVRTEVETDAYTRYQVIYRSGELSVSGVLLRPRGEGPFPGVVLNHGYIEPSVYVTGQGLDREQDALARAGFVVLHTDYRGHAASDPVGPIDRESRLGYTRDAVNAVRALERLPYVDRDRLAMLGRSMGGGVTLNTLVTHPGLVDAAVVYAGVSSLFLENLRHFTEPNRPEAASALYETFGTPAESPDFYRELSSRTYFDRITEPLLLHHGTDDESCPFPWARATQRALLAAGVESRLEEYQGEMHSFVPRWQLSMDRTVRFLREQFRGSSAG